MNFQKKKFFLVFIICHFEIFNALQTISNITSYGSIDLNTIVKRLEEYAPLNTATDWDNVGLLVEPSDPLEIRRILITNDLTQAVLNEALVKKGNAITNETKSTH